ncbi:hypothetical protein VTN31DRAFT_3117 [Thermomyces dupontii]|uniref:uncharacterized protein n=1 Tax=Talaromyces thermophilus TaxID=28565 RepID=UPI00374469E2
MASLSEEELRVIRDHPLGNALDTLIEPLRDVDSSYSSEGVDDEPKRFGNLLSKLILAFCETEAALKLRSRTSGRDLLAELFSVYQGLRSGDVHFAHYRPLVKLIIQKAADVEIRRAIFDLIAKISRATPLPPVDHNVRSSTPFRTNSGSLQGSEQTRTQVELRVFKEIQDCTYRNVRGFHEKYFENKDWTDRAQKVYQSMRYLHSGGRWDGLSNHPSQQEVFERLSKLQEDFLSEQQRGYYTIDLPRELVGGEARRRIDVIVKRKNEDTSDDEHDWRDIEVIGELKASNHGV